MKTKTGWLLLLIFAVLNSSAQFSKYIIQFRDKAASPYSISQPAAYLSQRAIQKKQRAGISIQVDDLPVNPAYISSVLQAGAVTLLSTSRWFNQICIQTNDLAALATIRQLSWVASVKAVSARPPRPINFINKWALPAAPSFTTPQKPADPSNNRYSYGNAYQQIHLHQGDFLHNLGFNGKAVVMAVTDAGFYHYNTLPTFDSIIQNGQVLGTWDFVAHKKSVSEEHEHGMKCLSTIAGNLPGKLVGTAPGASFYLFRTEDIAAEYPAEEQNWLAAAERADSLGVDIISVSLGYFAFDDSQFNYTYAAMDGNTSLIAKAVNMAAEKGMLVVVAAGNEGNNAWHYITTPGDARAALTVGAVNAAGVAAGFSSYGPASSGQVKPDVAAIGMGTAVASQLNGLPVSGNGTSYACPVMAGVLTCLLQAFPEVAASHLINAVQQSSSQYSQPDNRMGFGIPDAKKAFVLLQKQTLQLQADITDSCQARIHCTIKAGMGMQVLVERRLGNLAYTIADTLTYTGLFTKQTLTFVDNLAAYAPGTVASYRLRMLINADTNYYLDSVMLPLQNDCRLVEEKIVFAPNPVTDELTVQLQRNTSALLLVQVYNAAGHLLISRQQNTTDRIYRMPIAFKQLPSGVYYVSVWVDEKKQYSKKIIKQ
jgi:serine protease AprX